MTEKDFKQIFPLGEKNDAYGQIYAEKFTSASLICKVFYGKMKAQWGKYTLLLNLL